MSRFALTLGSAALATVATLATAPALADCVPGTGLCANVGVPGAQAQVSVGIPTFASPYAPAPQAAPPPAYYPQQPQAVYDDEPPARARRRYRAPAFGVSKLGLDLRLNAAAGLGSGRTGNAFAMGGAGLGLRYHGAGHLGFEAGLDLLGGRDYNEMKRLEIVGTVGGLVFFNPRSRVQVYGSGGFLIDHARAKLDVDYAKYPAFTNTYTHLGGYAGLGLEMFATRNIAFHIDARGILRQKVGGNTNAPEFVEPGTGRSTNLSGGLVGNAGMTIYF